MLESGGHGSRVGQGNNLVGEETRVSAISLHFRMSSRMLPIWGVQRSMASSTASLDSVPLGSTRHRFMMPLYSPISDAVLQNACNPVSKEGRCT